MRASAPSPSRPSLPGVLIPGWVSDFASFRRWSLSDDFPDAGALAYLGDRLWVDLSMERAIHNQIKGECHRVLAGLVKGAKRGVYFADGMRLVHPEVGLSSEPDGMFVSAEALTSGAVRLEEGDESLEVIGAPAMVLEVISKSSEKKDREILPPLYFDAGIDELWLIDSQVAYPELAVYRRGPSRFALVRRQAGWVRSSVFDAAFRLSIRTTDNGLSDITLEVR